MSTSGRCLKNKVSQVKDKFFFVKSPFKNISTLGKEQAGPEGGNIVFQAKQTDTIKIGEKIKRTIVKEFGFDVPVITLVQTELETVINPNPFSKDKSKNPAFFHITFLSGNPKKENLDLIKPSDFKNDKYKLINNTIYLYCPDGYSNSKLTNIIFENKLKVTATTRNWKTTNELLKMVTK